MSWTYDPTIIASDSLMQVRYLVGDTDETDQQLQDEEIAWQLTQEGDVYSTAIAGVRGLIAKYARLVDKRVGDFSLSDSQRLSGYRSLMASLKQRQALGAIPFAGGISVGDKEAREDDTDRVVPFFRRDSGDIAGTSVQDLSMAEREA